MLLHSLLWMCALSYLSVLCNDCPVPMMDWKATAQEEWEAELLEDVGVCGEEAAQLFIRQIKRCGYLSERHASNSWCHKLAMVDATALSL